jgi:hypothetical protein
MTCGYPLELIDRRVQRVADLHLPTVPPATKELLDAVARELLDCNTRAGWL